MSASTTNLSQEIIDNVLQHLSINDIENISNSIKISNENEIKLGSVNQIEATLNDKVNPIKYLDKAFYNSKELFINMGITDTLLSGSRALEYFIGNVCDDNSDWDFYCPDNAINIFCMMKSLEESGVVWESMKDKLHRLITNTEDQVLIDNLNESLEDLRDINSEFYTTITKKDNLHLIHMLEYSYMGDMPCKTVHGIVTKNNKRNKVQLIYSHCGKLPIDLILAFHSSIVQCFIGFSGACHLYYDNAVKRESYYWKNNQGCLTNEIFEKYLNRKIKFIHSDTQSVIENTDQMYKVRTDDPIDDGKYFISSNDIIKHRMVNDKYSKFISFSSYNMPIIDESITFHTTAYTYSYNGMNPYKYITESESKIKYISWYQFRNSLVQSDNAWIKFTKHSVNRDYIYYNSLDQKMIRFITRTFISSIKDNIHIYTNDNNKNLSNAKIINIYLRYYNISHKTDSQSINAII